MLVSIIYKFTHTPSGMYYTGRKHSDETKALMSNSIKLWWGKRKCV